MTITFQPGVLPPHPDDDAHPRIRYADHLVREVTAPAAVDHLSAVPDEALPMDGNDQYGNCVVCGKAHSIACWTALAQGEPVVVSQADVVADYFRETGGDDVGLNMQDSLNDWRKTGVRVGGTVDSILLFGQVDEGNVAECVSALRDFGALLIAVDLPRSAEDQFNNGDGWSYVSGSHSLGGHCVQVGAYDPAAVFQWRIVTWGQKWPMDQSFWDRKVREVWFAVSPDWVNTHSGVTPTGLDVYLLGESYAALTGQPNPFPVPVDPPAPTPPTPGPVVNPTDDLADDLIDWLKSNHPKFKRLVASAKAWLESLGRS